MDFVKSRSKAPAARNDSIKPNNALQSDFNETDGSSVDSDERYLVRRTGS